MKQRNNNKTRETSTEAFGRQLTRCELLTVTLQNELKKLREEAEPKTDWGHVGTASHVVIELERLVAFLKNEES